MTAANRHIVAALLLALGAVACTKEMTFQLDGKGRFVYYGADHDGDTVVDLFRSELATGAVTQLSAPLGENERIVGYAVDLKSRFVVYQSIGEQGGEDVVPASGLWLWDNRTEELVELDLQLDDDELIAACELDPRRRFIFFQTAAVMDVDEEPVLSGGGLFRLDPKTGAISQVSADLPDDTIIVSFRIAHSGRFIVYQTVTTVDGSPTKADLFVVDVKTGDVDEVDIEDLGGEVLILSYRLDSRGHFALLNAAVLEGTDPVPEGALYQVDFKSGEVTKLSGSLLVTSSPARGDPPEYQLDRKGRAVVYMGQSELGVNELHHTDLESGATTQVSGPAVEGGSVQDFQLDPSGRFAVYRADQDLNGVFELYRSDFATSAVTKLNPELVEGGDVLDDYQLGPRGRFVVYLADQATDGVTELHRVISGSGAVNKVNAELVENGNVVDFQLHPKGRSIVYRADQEVSGAFELYRFSGKTSAVTKLSAELVEAGQVFDDYQLDPRGRFVVYRAVQETAGVSELFRTNFKGGPVTKVSGEMLGGGSGVAD